MDRVHRCRWSFHSWLLAFVVVGCGDADDATHGGPCATTDAASAPMTSALASGADEDSGDSAGSGDSTPDAASTTSPGTTSTGGGDTSSGGADDPEGASESGDFDPGETGASGETTEASSTGGSSPGTTGTPGETTEATSTGDTGDTGETTGDTTGDGQAGPSFAADVWPLLDDGCGCHQDNNGAGKLHLTSKDAYDNLVGVPSDQLPSMRLVEPGDASQSYLWHKMDNTHKSVGGEGKKMPPGGLLGQSEREIVQQWIDQGAQP